MSQPPRAASLARVAREFSAGRVAGAARLWGGAEPFAPPGDPYSTAVPRIAKEKWGIFIGSGNSQMGHGVS